MNPNNNLFDDKRLIGQKFSEASVQSNMKWWPFKVILGPSDNPIIVVSYKAWPSNLQPLQFFNCDIVCKEVENTLFAGRPKKDKRDKNFDLQLFDKMLIRGVSLPFDRRREVTKDGWELGFDLVHRFSVLAPLRVWHLDAEWDENYGAFDCISHKFWSIQRENMKTGDFYTQRTNSIMGLGGGRLSVIDQIVDLNWQYCDG